MTISPAAIKEVKDRSGAPLLACKDALVIKNGNVEEALTYLIEKNIVRKVDKAKIPSQGMVTSYIHMDGKIGVLLEINCVTDFVARSPEFKEFCDEISMQICGLKPEYVCSNDIPQAVTFKQLDIYQAQVEEEKKPEASWQKIREGRLDKWEKEVCLLEQNSLLHSGKTVAQVLEQVSSKFGEKIVIRRFVRWELGEGIQKQQTKSFEQEVAELAGLEKK
jgi:elongation factor Ts